MRVIHKFGPFTPNKEITVTCKKTVHFGLQDGCIHIWAEVDKESHRNKERTFIIIGTGWDYEYEFDHIQSLVDSAGYVWHLLQVRNDAEMIANSIFPTF